MFTHTHIKTHAGIHTFKRYRETHCVWEDGDKWYWTTRTSHHPSLLHNLQTQRNTHRVQGCRQLIDFKDKVWRQQVYQMAHKMPNKCHSIYIAARCLTRLADAFVGDLTARLLFGTSFVFNLHDEVEKYFFTLHSHSSFSVWDSTEWIYSCWKVFFFFFSQG